MNDAQLLVCTFAEKPVTQHVLDNHFRACPNGTILFDNNYFKALVKPVVIQVADQDLLLNDDKWKSDVRVASAVVLLCTDRDLQSISRCKMFWDRLRESIDDCVVRLLFVEGEHMSERDTYELVGWGVRNHIEVVNAFLCVEDNVEISVRLERILECAAWSAAPRCNAQDETPVLESQPNLLVTDANQVTECESSLSKPTRLRRGLRKGDVTRVIDDLVDADDTDSNS